MLQMERVHDAPDIYLMRVPLRQSVFGEVNCYIIVDGGDYLIVDPGELLPENEPLFGQALADLGLDRSRLRIYLTHLHSDHSGMVDVLATPNTPVYAGRVDYAYFDAENDPAVVAAIAQQLRDEGIAEDEIAMAMAIRSTRAHLPNPLGCKLVFIDSGEKMRVGRHEFVTVGVSGHSPLGMALHHIESGTMIVGDHVLFGITPVIDSTRETGNGLRKYVESLQMLGEMRIETMLPGHGQIGEDHYGRMRKVASRKLDQARAMRDTIAAHPGCTGYDAIQSAKWGAVKGIWGNAPLGARAFIANDGCITLDYLVEVGEVDRTRGDDGVCRYRTRKG